MTYHLFKSLLPLISVKSHGIEYIILIWSQKLGHTMTWIAYHPLPDVYEYLKHIAETYPDICEVTAIGESFEGQDIKLIKISNGRPKNKAIWIDGGIHARLVFKEFYQDYSFHRFHFPENGSVLQWPPI